MGVHKSGDRSKGRGKAKGKHARQPTGGKHAEQLVAPSEPTRLACSDCKGRGKISFMKCTTCKGTGEANA
jgi:DnaJ-class molecular chaperone